MIGETAGADLGHIASWAEAPSSLQPVADAQGKWER
jgi:hypothetical protein